MNNQFSENLKRIRKENNLSQEQLADELGVSRQAISKWESSQAYPEMDKIIALCNKFHLNIDDLLNKDIKEVKGEEESKRKINSIIDDFLSFITNTINMFSQMSFKSKIKCLFEQFVIALILFIISICLYSILDSLFVSVFQFLPDIMYTYIVNFFQSILIVGLIVISIIIISHIFKTRYLDYFDNMKKEVSDNEEVSINDTKSNISKNNFEKKEDKIIIRDPKHSEYRFIKVLFKIVVLIVKFFLLCFGLLVCGGLILLFAAFIGSFLVYKTGFFFIGIMLAAISFGVIGIIFLLMILNFVFDRNSNKKKMIWSFIISLIGIGIGCGFIFIGSLSFDVMEYDDNTIKTVTKEYDMRDDLFIHPFNRIDIQYIEADNSNVKIDYVINKYCDISLHNDYHNGIREWAYCDNPFKIGREFIKNVNLKKIISYNNDIYSVKVYTNHENIEKLKSNWDNYLDNISNCDNKMIDLENQNRELRDRVFDLEEQIKQYDNHDS